MTLSQAHLQAQRRSKKTGKDVYIVRGDDEGWDVTDDYGLDTFYLGAHIEAHYLGGELLTDC
jgi:hypothetical protein